MLEKVLIHSCGQILVSGRKRGGIPDTGAGEEGEGGGNYQLNLLDGGIRVGEYREVIPDLINQGGNQLGAGSSVRKRRLTVK